MTNEKTNNRKGGKNERTKIPYRKLNTRSHHLIKYIHTHTCTYIYIHTHMVCIHTYISRLYVYIYRFARVPCPLFTERFAFPPSRPNLGAVFPRCVFLFVPSFSPPASIPFVLSLRTSLASSEHVLFALLFPFPLPRSTHPVLQLALRSVSPSALRF